MAEKGEKPAVRPDWLNETEWGNADILKGKREELQKTIRARNNEQSVIEEAIRKSGLLSKRMRELNPPLKIPIDGRDDKGTRLREPRVHERALRMAESTRNHHAHSVSAGDTGDLDRAALAVRRHSKGVSVSRVSGGIDAETK